MNIIITHYKALYKYPVYCTYLASGSLVFIMRVRVDSNRAMGRIFRRWLNPVHHATTKRVASFDVLLSATILRSTWLKMAIIGHTLTSPVLDGNLPTTNGGYSTKIHRYSARIPDVFYGGGPHKGSGQLSLLSSVGRETAKEQWRVVPSMAGKVTGGQCATDRVIYHLRAQAPKEGRWTPVCASLRSIAHFTFSSKLDI